MKATTLLGHSLHGSGPHKVIALHDWMGDAGNWEAMHPFLDTDSFTYAFAEVRGYGESQSIEGRYDSVEIALDVFDLATALGWDRFHLIGHSMTGMAVQKALILDKTHRIQSLVAVTPVSAGGFPVDEETLAFFRGVISNPETAKVAFGVMTSDRLTETWQLRRAGRLHGRVKPEAMEGYLNMWLKENFLTQLQGIETPILVLYGEEDHPQFRREAQEAAFAPYSNVLLKGIPAVGHYPMQELPLYTLSLMEEFLSSQT